MSDARPHTRGDSVHAQRESVVSPPVERPWPLVALAVACIFAVIAGSPGPWTTFERVSDTAAQPWTIPGYRSDGLFAVAFAAGALISLGTALLREGNEPWAWAASGLMAWCALIGLAGRFMFAPPERTIPPGETGTFERLGWGVTTVGVAGPLVALATWLVARHLDRGAGWSRVVNAVTAATPGTRIGNPDLLLFSQSSVAPWKG